ncbi:MAG TPA: hypothetical protein VN958_06660 [Chitinophagaceae bacterium]|nr:hypothetical protein [Chitinophagaceae bacterium]
MSRQQFDGSARKYTLTVFLSFVGIFCFVMLMKLWQGDFKPGVNENASVVVTGSTEVLNERTKNMTGDSTQVPPDSSSMTMSDSTKKMSSDTSGKKSSDTTGKKK